MEKISKFAKIGVLQANLFCMDFAGNYRIILNALKKAEAEGVSVLVCPELCITGPDCDDHFFEKDTVRHSWEILAKLLNNAPSSILYGVGMPVNYNGALFDCMVYCYGKDIMLIRPKTVLNDSGNARQSRWFAAWSDIDTKQDFDLPEIIKDVNGQTSATFGGGYLKTEDNVILAPVIDNEIMSPTATYMESLNGVDIIMNSSAIYHEIGRYEKTLSYLKSYSQFNKIVLCYSNSVGCNGNRLYYDGGSLIFSNGDILAQTPRFSLEDFNIAVATINLDDLHNIRSADKLFASQVYHANQDIEIIQTGLSLKIHSSKDSPASIPLEIKPLPLYQELTFCGGNWIWDYLRRSGAIGFFIALSGGADSSCCSTLVHLLSERLLEQFKNKNETIVNELHRISNDPHFTPENAKQITHLLLHTAYLGTVNSSKETRDRAQHVADAFGVKHIDGTIDDAVEGIKKAAKEMTGFEPRFEEMGGSKSEDLALQNVQARTRLIISYFVAQVLPNITKRKGFFLVMATGNGDECIRGYFTKYDNSSGDLDPIGSWSKSYVNAVLEGWSEKYPILKEVRGATPSAELKPKIGLKQEQTDEADMGFTYSELGLLGKLRKVDNCGPVSMFEKLLGIWTEKKPEDIAQKVKNFFRFNSITRHKMATLPPGLHSTAANCDDNRYDQRQILYEINWKHQFECLDKIVAEFNKH